MPFTSKHRFIHILSHIHLSNNHLFFTYPLRELIFGHYILSFPLSYHTPSVITQITFLNAPSKSPYKQMHGSRARSDAYEQTRRIFTLPSRKRLKEQPNQPLFLMFSISLKFECLRSASVGAKRTSTGCPAPSFMIRFPVHDPIRPVDLLQQDHAHQLMRKRHFRKADLLLR